MSISKVQKVYKDTITILANGEIEYKLWMLKQQKLSYSWASNVKLYYDFHGEPSTAVNSNKLMRKKRVINPFILQCLL